MLYLEDAGSFAPWDGEAIGDTRYPASIENVWSPDELAAVGLYVPADPGIPENKVEIKRSVQRINGTVTIVYELADSPPPTKDDLDIERERRIALPLTVTVQGIGTFPINMDDPSQRNTNGLGSSAILLKITANPATVKFRDFNNTDHDMNADQLISMCVQAQQRISAVYTKSWAIKALKPVPADYTDDKYW
jgi:hypothetical protein